MLKKKKILHIITSLGDGGAEGVLYRLISETNKIVHHEVIVLSKDNKYEGLLRSKKVKIFNINLKKNNSIKGCIDTMPNMVDKIFLAMNMI